MKFIVEIDGQQVPLADCFWVRFNPDGCAEGSTYAVSGNEVIGTPEQAHQRFEHRQRDRAREIRQGYRHELLTHAQWDDQARACLLGQCGHRTAKEAAA